MLCRQLVFLNVFFMISIGSLYLREPSGTSIDSFDYFIHLFEMYSTFSLELLCVFIKSTKIKLIDIRYFFVL